MDWMIAMEDPNSDAPILPSDDRFWKLRNLPYWGLCSQQETLRFHGTEMRGEPCYEELGMFRFTSGQTYDEALRAASIAGLEGSPIGGR